MTRSFTLLTLALLAGGCAQAPRDTSDAAPSSLTVAPTPPPLVEPAPAKTADAPLQAPPPVVPALTPPAKAAVPAPAKAPTPAAAPAAAKPAPAVAAAPRAAPAPAAAPTLDLKTLESRLRGTSAIGVMTKLSLKNQVDDLVKRFRAYHSGSRPPQLAELRPSYEVLVMKFMTLLQDKDAALAKDINASRESIWALLSDREKLSQYA